MRLFVRIPPALDPRLDYAVAVLARRLAKLGIEVAGCLVPPKDTPVLDIAVQDLGSTSQAFSMKWMPDVDLGVLFNPYFTYTLDESAEKLDVAEIGNLVKNTGRLAAHGPAGVLYGLIEFAERCETRGCLPVRPLDIAREPQMPFRSACLQLMKTGRYDLDICQAEFPWFYDRAWWTAYLDFLAENRFNAVTLWNFHPFPYFVAIKGYEGLSPVSADQLAQNHAQLMWICTEAARRSMTIVFHFYNIYVSHRFAASIGMRSIRHFTIEQKPLVERYMFECVRQLVAEFPAVGLMACLGEGVTGEAGGRFAGEVLIPAIKAAGKRPPLIIRQWSSLKVGDVADHVLGRYDNLFVMLKHNAEHIAGEVPDARMRKWAGLGVPCIVNMHMISEVGPFRWAPVTFINRLCLTYHALDLKGLHLYPHWPWRTPVTGDRGYPDGEIDRDRLYHEAWGRYSFDPIRDEDEEARFWVRRMAARFGGREKAKAVIESQNVMGRALTRLQQHLWIHYDNHSILAAGFTLGQYAGALSMHGRKVVLTDILDDLFPLGLELTQGHRPGSGDYTIDDCLADSIRDVDAGIRLLSASGIQADGTEPGRYRTDAELVRQVLEFHSVKTRAARLIFAYTRQGGQESLTAGLGLLERAVAVYRALARQAQTLYEGISDVTPLYPKAMDVSAMPYHWTDMLLVFDAELDGVRQADRLARQGDAEAAAAMLGPILMEKNKG
jgi:hypothetical protein